MRELDTNKLKVWINILSYEKLKQILATCINEFYYGESIRMNEDGIPYWTETGDNLDD